MGGGVPQFLVGRRFVFVEFPHLPLLPTNVMILSCFFEILSILILVSESF